MEIETLQAMSDGLARSLLQMIEVIVLINIALVIVGFIIYLAGIIRLCLAETQRSITAPGKAPRALPLNAWPSSPRVSDASHAEAA